MCGAGRDGPFGQTKTEVHYEQHHHVARHWSDCVLCLRRHLGAQPLVGRSPRLRGVKEAKPESWRGVSDTPRQLFTDQSMWRDGDWNGRIRADLGSIRDDRAQLGSLNSVGGAVEERRYRGNYDTVCSEG